MALKKNIIFLSKVLLAGCLLYFLLQKTDLALLWYTIKTISLSYLGGAFFFLFLSHYISSLRLRYYFMHLGYGCEKLFIIALYFVGAFYNLLLPGGIGGDGYVIWKSRQILSCTAKHGLYAVIQGRANGLFLLIIFGLCLSFFCDLVYYHSFFVIFFATTIVSLFCYILGMHLLFKHSFKTIIRASMYSFWVQGCTLVCCFFLIKGLHLMAPSPEMLFLFLASSVAAILPISVGGIGLREYTFFYGCPLLQISPTEGIALAVTYFFVNTSITLLGGVAVFILNKYDSLQRNARQKGDFQL